MGDKRDLPGCHEAQSLAEARHYCSDVEASSIDCQILNVEPKPCNHSNRDRVAQVSIPSMSCDLVPGQFVIQYYMFWHL